MAGTKIRRLGTYSAVLPRHLIPKQKRRKHEFEVYCEVEEEFFTNVPTNFIDIVGCCIGNSAS